jgi:hypothetical protein
MKSRAIGIRLLARVPWAALAVASTATAGTVTMHTITDFDKTTCAAFRKMVVAADIAGMTDQQLCDFRFARLPASATKGFTFPRWKELKVSDPVETFRSVSLGNMHRAGHTAGYPTDLVLESVSVNSKANNLRFYTTDVQYQGKGPVATLLLADVVSCPKGTFNNEMDAPALFSFNDQNLTKQEPMDPSSAASAGTELAFWKGNIPVVLSISNRWIKLSSQPGPGLDVELMSWYRRKDGDDPEYIYEYPVCAVTLKKRK